MNTTEIIGYIILPTVAMTISGTWAIAKAIFGEKKRNSEPNEDIYSYSCVTCTLDGGYGWTTQYNTVEECISEAIKICQDENIGDSAYILCLSTKEGYGCIAKSGSTIGASCGCESQESAKNAAILDCKNRGGKRPRVVESFS